MTEIIKLDNVVINKKSKIRITYYERPKQEQTDFENYCDFCRFVKNCFIIATLLLIAIHLM